MAWTEEITVEEKTAVEELKRRMIKHVTPKMLEDESLFYRFSKARDFNVEKAEIMLRKHIAFRKEYQIDTILEDYKPPENFTKYFSSSFIGFDKEECLIRYFDAGNFDNRGIFNITKTHDLHKGFFQITETDAETMKQHSNKIGKQVTKTVYIFNFENFSLYQVTHRQSLVSFLYLCRTYQDNHPERLKICFAINAPACLSIILALMKPVVVSSLMEKIHCYGTDGWKKELLETIDEDVLPVFLGGKKTDPDGNPMCKSFINHGQTIPRRCYLSNDKKKTSLQSDSKKLVIARSSKEEVNFIVEKPGSHIEWEFETKSKDIGFSMYFKKNSKHSKPVELVPNQRIETTFEPEKGFYKCETVGIYTIVFDNTYSWIHGKEVHYRTRLSLPNVDEN